MTTDLVYTCQTCSQTHSLQTSDDKEKKDCPNCAPIDYVCTRCTRNEKILFAHGCNVCVQSETLFCKTCLPIKQNVILCDGCLYPVCLKHADKMEAFSVQKNAKIFFHFCNAFEDRYICFNAFVRMRVVTSGEFDNLVYFGSDWFARMLPELCVTRKWAAKQQKILIKK